MYKLMIVDDEPLFTDGLAECLRDLRNPEWEIFKAYHAEDALERLERVPVDVLLLDIRMPGMNGLELHREVQRRWPKCKVLFLTGHDEFGYVQEALRQGGTEYILKTEGDEVIIAALEKTAKELDADDQRDQWAAQARARWVQAKSSLHKSLFMELVSGEAEVEQLAEQFEDLAISLNPQQPVLMALGKVDQWRTEVRPADRSLFLFAVQNVAQDLLRPSTSLFSIDIDRSHILWFIQTSTPEASQDRALLFAQGIMGQVQEKCAQLFKLEMSLVISDKFVPFQETHVQYHQLKNKLFRHFGLQNQLFLIDHKQEGQEAGKTVYQHKLAQLKFAIEHNRRAEFRHALMQFEELSGSQSRSASWDRTQLYFTLVSIALDTMRQWDLREEVEARIDLSALFSGPPLESWDRFLALYGELIELLFDKRSREWEQQGMDVIMRIKAFIVQELHADLSLSRIAEYVSYHPAYLSRLYKQLSGRSLSEDIAEMRLKRAEQLLPDKQLKINEIGKTVGFDSPRYFTKFFKSHTGLTPQEFRERSGQ
ncbi:response regulator [Paenibacillus mendelii]|uniref:Response regulator n=1 Tax=Paenibacillus mendelii TaxID=206163 RepID=A0ABV6J382_9BACL|nr:response regulator [Paenibacillus mendelii]MCQ6559425.1 response regulator [Paenibacillus mendelii]